jgi:hypothetical protein
MKTRTKIDTDYLYDTLADVERRAARGMPIKNSNGSLRVVSSKEEENYKFYNRNLAAWLRAYIEAVLRGEIKNDTK